MGGAPLIENFLIKSLSVTPVPEPTTRALMLAGVFRLGGLLRSRRQALRVA
ncbi:MAG: PEP-CTERM sorting domain-containing protein [Caulobacteraceae bacterium]